MGRVLVAVGILAFVCRTAAAENAPPLPVNQWVQVEDAPDGGCRAGLVYLPEESGAWLFGRRVRKDWRGQVISGRYWVEFFDPHRRTWTEWVPEAGRLEAGLGRGAHYTQWVKDPQTGYEMPALPGYNAGCWEAHQRCYLPDQKKVLIFQGGVTFTYDPATRTFQNLGLSFGQAPPDAMLGSMAWDPVNSEAILFGGGYLQAYQARPGDVKEERPADAWTPEKWDRRGTWAFDPVKNQWRKLETASNEIAAANSRLVEFGAELRTLWGATRGIAFEYGDMVLNKKPAELADLIVKTAADLGSVGRGLSGQGTDDYEKWQFATAATLIEKEIVPRLNDAATALRAEDGWRAFRALDQADQKLIEAQEALAVAPRPRHYACLVADPKNQVMVLWGGDGEDRFFADTWLFHLARRRWERVVKAVHPPPVGSAMVAMDYDAKNQVVVLAHQNGQAWVFDAAKREWKRLDLAGPTGGTFRSLVYDPNADTHVLVVMAGKGRAPRQTALLRLDVAQAAAVEVKEVGPEEVWRPQYGAGSAGPADKYALAWSFLPKSQAEYREKVAAHQKVLDAVPPNTWTQLKQVYSGFGRAYGSFCYDWERDEMLLWGGGHSAYMGNEWSHYDLKSNLWMESWNPEYPAHPYGSPDGPGWHPSFYHEKGTHHGYHHYVYNATLKKVAFGGSLLYDLDRMRYAPARIRMESERPGQSGGLMVEMNGAPGMLMVSAQHWYGGPFGVWEADLESLTRGRIKGSDTPFGTNDRAKIVFDTRRSRILFYGATNTKEKGGKCNALWTFPLETRKWEKIEPTVEPADAEPPAISAWNYCYSATHDGLFIPDKGGTWVYDCTTNVLRKLDVKPVATGAGVVYSAAHDLFYMLDGDGYRQQQVWVFRYRAR